mgnify:CR=1 FL=1
MTSQNKLELLGKLDIIIGLLKRHLPNIETKFIGKQDKKKNNKDTVKTPLEGESQLS